LKDGRQTYGQKDVEFQRFIALERKVKPTVIEITLSETPLLGWQIDDRSLPPAVRNVIRNQTKRQKFRTMAQVLAVYRALIPLRRVCMLNSFWSSHLKS
jgi:hypothetical protein